MFSDGGVFPYDYVTHVCNSLPLLLPKLQEELLTIQYKNKLYHAHYYNKTVVYLLSLISFSTIIVR